MLQSPTTCYSNFYSLCLIFHSQNSLARMKGSNPLWPFSIGFFQPSCWTSQRLFFWNPELWSSYLLYSLLIPEIKTLLLQSILLLNLWPILLACKQQTQESTFHSSVFIKVLTPLITCSLQSSTHSCYLPVFRATPSSCHSHIFFTA